jgi:DNA primase
MAPYIPENKILEIKEAATITDLIGQYVNLKARGRYLVGLCPFHAESTPSFTVYPERQIFHCFGCGVGGNVFTFLMQHQRLTFPEAVGELARKYGIPLSLKDLGQTETKQARQRQAFFDVNALAARFFQANLHNQRLGAVAQAYLERRGLTPEIVAAYKLGFVPDEWRNLERYLSEQGGSLEAAREVGLLIARQSGGHYDRFRGRLMFPIQDREGRVIAFGGRVLGAGEPKYLNSPESPIYSKGRSLYGLFQAREAMRQQQLAILVEGYMDLLALRVHGIDAVVASLGTALTREQVRQLKGYAARVVLVFDGDEAGLKAMMRSFPYFTAERLPVRVLALPAGEDPDSYVAKEGPEIFHAAWEQAQPLFEFIMDKCIASHPDGVEGKMAALEQMKPYFQAMSDPVERALWIQPAAKRFGVAESALEKSIGGISAPVEHRPSPQKGLSLNLERGLIKLILTHPVALSRLGLEDYLEEFEDQDLRAIAQQILVCYQQQGQLDYSLLVTQMADQSLQNKVCALSLDEEEFICNDLDLLITDFGREFKKRRIKKQQRKIQQQLDRASINQMGEELLTLLARKKEIDRQLGELTNAQSPTG